MLRLWGEATSEEESRTYFQTRLTVLFKLMFWSFVALIAFLFSMYTFTSTKGPALNNWVYLVSGIGLAIMAFIWRVLLVRRELSFEALHGIDLFYCTGCGLVIGGSALISYDFRPSAYTCVIYACFAVLTRALVLPSTERRTAVASTLTFVPTTIAAAILAWKWPQELPRAAFFVGYLVVAIVAVLLSSAGSRIIYRLKREVSATEHLGEYRLGRKIGTGGMGAVYLAHHVMLRRPTALKLILPELVGAENLIRFEREVRLMSQLTHPNTVAIFDYGRSFEGVLYYAMEYLGRGVDLEKLVALHGPQPAGRVIRILVQVCGSLQEAHALQLIHRDIKPANIILCDRGGVPDVVKVVDFGLVTEITATSGSGTILGTPAYIAPEAVTAPATIGPAVDLYALGAVGYFLLTGKRVFEGTTEEVCRQHVSATPARPSEVTAATIPAALEAVIMRCLAKAPSDRFASASALADALRALPPSHDWSTTDARSWWRERVQRDDVVDAATSNPTIITVDLGERAPNVAVPGARA
jgi:serine/threonine-protein kinase